MCPFLSEMFRVSGIILALGCLWVTVAWMLVGTDCFQQRVTEAHSGGDSVGISDWAYLGVQEGWGPWASKQGSSAIQGGIRLPSDCSGSDGVETAEGSSRGTSHLRRNSLISDPA